MSGIYFFRICTDKSIKLPVVTNYNSREIAKTGALNYKYQIYCRDFLTNQYSSTMKGLRFLNLLPAWSREDRFELEIGSNKNFTEKDQSVIKENLGSRNLRILDGFGDFDVGNCSVTLHAPIFPIGISMLALLLWNHQTILTKPNATIEDLCENIITERNSNLASMGKIITSFSFWRGYTGGGGLKLTSRYSDCNETGPNYYILNHFLDYKDSFKTFVEKFYEIFPNQIRDDYGTLASDEIKSIIKSVRNKNKPKEMEKTTETEEEY